MRCCWLLIRQHDATCRAVDDTIYARYAMVVDVASAVTLRVAEEDSVVILRLTHSRGAAEHDVDNNIRVLIHIRCHTVSVCIRYTSALRDDYALLSLASGALLCFFSLPPMTLSC